LKETDEAILFPEEEIAGYKVRPWSLGTVVALAPSIRATIQTCQQEGITADDYEMQIQEKFADILLLNAHHVPKIIAVSLGVSEEEAAGMPFPKAATILVGILKQNAAYIKNFFARMLVEGQSLKEASSGPSKSS